MSSLERDPVAIPGPRFSRGGDGKLLFSYVVDANTVVGPRPANARDKSEHAGAYRNFVADELAATAQGEGKGPFNGADPAKFDHDADGAPGGGPPGGFGAVLKKSQRARKAATQ